MKLCSGDLASTLVVPTPSARPTAAPLRHRRAAHGATTKLAGASPASPRGFAIRHDRRSASSAQKNGKVARVLSLRLTLGFAHVTHSARWYPPQPGLRVPTGSSLGDKGGPGIALALILTPRRIDRATVPRWARIRRWSNSAKDVFRPLGTSSGGDDQQAMRMMNFLHCRSGPLHLAAAVGAAPWGPARPVGGRCGVRRRFNVPIAALRRASGGAYAHRRRRLADGQRANHSPPTRWTSA